MESHIKQFEVNFVENEGIKRKIAVKILIFTEHTFFLTLFSWLIIFSSFQQKQIIFEYNCLSPP